MPPTANRSYRIKSTDSALTVPGRTTFPRGTYISRLPYAKSAGTPASGLAGVQGSAGAMYPIQRLAANVNQQQRAVQAANSTGPYSSAPPRLPGVNTTGFTTPSYNPATLAMRGRGYGQPVPQRFEDGSIRYPQQPYSVTSQGSNIENFAMRGRGYQPLSSAYGTDDSWWRPTAPATQTPSAAANLGPGQYLNAQGAVSQGATPFGVNAFGERLDYAGNVWNPETATTDIYGGRFVQPGETRWVRNNKGRLVKVEYGRNGQKRIVSGGKGQHKRLVAQRQAQAAQPQVVQPVQQTVQQPSIVSSMVTFRA